jgi:hypothetical protein
MDSKIDSPKRSQQTSKRKVDEDSEDDPGPIGPPKQARVIGPALPPPRPSEEEESESEKSEDESSDDDDFGPQLPSSKPDFKGSHAVSYQDRETHHAQTASVPDKAVSSNWMTISPEDEQRAGRAPQKLKNRVFQTGRAARTATTDTGGGGVAQQWAETVEEKRIRLENEIMGIKTEPRSTKQEASAHDAAASKARKITEERMRDFNEKTSRESLYTAKKRDAKDPSKEDDDPSARPFDREKDIGGSRTITNSQHRQMLNQASKYDSRFTKGSFL